MMAHTAGDATTLLTHERDNVGVSTKVGMHSHFVMEQLQLQRHTTMSKQTQHVTLCSNVYVHCVTHLLPLGALVKVLDHHTTLAFHVCQPRLAPTARAQNGVTDVELMVLYASMRL